MTGAQNQPVKLYFSAMATIFVSHAWTDLELARALQVRMTDNGHRNRIQVGVAVAGNWRAKYSQALASADVLIVLVTEASLVSPNALGEIGAARVLEHVRGMILLPVRVGNIVIPEFISDIYCFRLRDPNELDSLVKDLCKAIDDNTRLLPRVCSGHVYRSSGWRSLRDAEARYLGPTRAISTMRLRPKRRSANVATVL